MYFRFIFCDFIFQDILRSLKDHGFLSTLFSFVISYPSSANLADIKVSCLALYIFKYEEAVSYIWQQKKHDS